MPYFQGLFDKEGNQFGSELLVRLKNENKIILPGNFIPQIEEAKLISLIDLWSFEEACKWQQRYPKLQASCNISGDSLVSGFFFEKLSELTQIYAIDSSKISLELTESRDISLSAIATVEQLANLGYKLVLDDWGKEYSGFNRLYALPISKVKIDRFLIANLTTDNLVRNGNYKAIRIIEGMIEIARRLKIEILAEGVETKEQFELLKKLGCREFQGYYFNKPQSDPKRNVL